MTIRCTSRQRYDGIPTRQKLVIALFISDQSPKLRNAFAGETEVFIAFSIINYSIYLVRQPQPRAGNRGAMEEISARLEGWISQYHQQVSFLLLHAL